MPDEPSEELQRTVETLLATAERCYRLARGLTNQQAIEVLLRLAEECEQQKGAGARRGLAKPRSHSSSMHGGCHPLWTTVSKPYIADANRTLQLELYRT